MRRYLPPLNALRAFEAVARHMSVSQAATELCVTPAAVSHQLRLLEEHVGTRLFLRSGRGLALTPAGIAAARDMHQAFHHLNAAVKLMDSYNGETNIESGMTHRNDRRPEMIWAAPGASA